MNTYTLQMIQYVVLFIVNLTFNILAIKYLFRGGWPRTYTDRELGFLGLLTITQTNLNIV